MVLVNLPLTVLEGQIYQFVESLPHEVVTICGGDPELIRDVLLELLQTDLRTTDEFDLSGICLALDLSRVLTKMQYGSTSELLADYPHLRTYEGNLDVAILRQVREMKLGRRLLELISRYGPFMLRYPEGAIPIVELLILRRGGLLTIPGLSEVHAAKIQRELRQMDPPFELLS